LITYLLAILLTLMGLRLYSKGKQTYRKETQLLLAAKSAAKERRRLLLSPTSFVRLASGQQTDDATGGDAATAAGGVSAGAVAVPAGIRRPSSRSSGSILGRSLSRLQGSLVVGLPELETALSSRAPTPSSWSLLSPAGRHSLLGGAPAEADAPDRETGGRDQQAPTGQAVESYMCSTLFQVRR
jgi:hypothetical protein